MGTAYSKLRKALPILFRQQTDAAVEDNVVAGECVIWPNGNPLIQCTHHDEDDERLHNRAELGGMMVTAPRDEQDGGWCGWMSEKGYAIEHPTDEV